MNYLITFKDGHNPQTYTVKGCGASRQVANAYIFYKDATLNLILYTCLMMDVVSIEPAV